MNEERREAVERNLSRIPSTACWYMYTFVRMIPPVVERRHVDQPVVEVDDDRTAIIPSRCLSLHIPEVT
jgi:hypothetical protein